MAQLDDVQKFQELASKARDLKELERLLESMTFDLGFHFYALVQHVDIRKSSNSDMIWLENYPDSWADVFVETGLYANDPIHFASQHRSTGFIWSEVASFMRLTAHHKRVLEQAGREGMGDGFTVPAHVPGESRGTCSFGVRRGAQLPTHNLMAAQLVGLFAFEAGRKIVARKIYTELEKPKLTPRQVECLVYVSRGKSDWEISQILGIKETTVRDYIEEACSRYGVNRRVQLVIRALHDGHVSLRDTLG